MDGVVDMGVWYSEGWDWADMEVVREGPGLGSVGLRRAVADGEGRAAIFGLGPIAGDGGRLRAGETEGLRDVDCPEGRRL